MSSIQAVCMAWLPPITSSHRDDDGDQERDADPRQALGPLHGLLDLARELGARLAHEPAPSALAASIDPVDPQQESVLARAHREDAVVLLVGTVQGPDGLRQSELLRERRGFRHAADHQMDLSALEILEQGVRIAVDVDHLRADARGQPLDDGAVLLGIPAELQNPHPQLRP